MTFSSPWRRITGAVATGRSLTPLERLIEVVLLLCGFVSILVTVTILWVLLRESYDFFASVSLSSFFSSQWRPTSGAYGVWPLMVGTFLVATIAMCIAAPLGTLAGIYLREFAPPRVRRIIKPLFVFIAGLPTIVFAFFALLVITPSLHFFIDDLQQFNALAPGLVIGIMLIPAIAVQTDNALSDVPREVRDGAFALGASSVRNVFRVLLPTAKVQLATAVVVAYSRAIGETVIVAVAAGVLPRMSIDPREPSLTLGGSLVHATRDASIGEAVFAVASLLLVVTIVLNWLSRRMDKVLHAAQVVSTATARVFTGNTGGTHG